MNKCGYRPGDRVRVRTDRSGESPLTIRKVTYQDTGRPGWPPEHVVRAEFVDRPNRFLVKACDAFVRIEAADGG